MLYRIAFLCFATFSCTCFAAYDVSRMTLEEKVGQLLMVHVQGESAGYDAEKCICQLHVGGIIYYNWSNGLHSPEQVWQLSHDLQILAKQTRLSIPLFIAADQEGGRVARLKQGFTQFPGNAALAKTHRPELARQVAYVMGQEMRAVGVNFNLAPVIDVNNNPRNPVIGTRSFGDKPEVVITFGANALCGYTQAGVITSLKHFPGHGDVEVDSHVGLPVVNKSREELEACEFAPFAALVDKADTVMTAHILLPQIDPEACATLSKSVLGILRHDMHFKGVIITDSLVMEGVLHGGISVDRAAILALNAGCDILLLGGNQLLGDHHRELTVDDIERIHHNLVAAVESGEIDESRVDVAVERILSLKARYDLMPTAASKAALQDLINTEEHKKLAENSI